MPEERIFFFLLYYFHEGDLAPDDDTEWMTITEEDLEKMMKPLENMGKNPDSNDLFGGNPEFNLGE